MENLSFSNHLDHEMVSFTDDSVSESTEGRVRRIAPTSPSAYSAVGLLDSLSAYAAVFGCSATCIA